MLITAGFGDGLDSEEDGEDDSRSKNDFDSGPDPSIFVGSGVFDRSVAESASDGEEDDGRGEAAQSVCGLVNPRQGDVESPEGDFGFGNIGREPISVNHLAAGDGLEDPKEQSNEGGDQDGVEEHFLKNGTHGGLFGPHFPFFILALAEGDARNDHVGVAIEEDTISNVHDVEIVAGGLAVDGGDERISEERS